MSKPNGPADQNAGPTTSSQPAADAPVSRARLVDADGQPKLRIRDVAAGTPFVEAALAFYAAGFDVIPQVPGTKRPAVKWDGWLAGLSPEAIRHYWMMHPDHELGCVLDARMLVLDADTQLATTALDILETKHGAKSNLITRTRRGQHRYYQLADGVVTKTKAYSTEEHPERIDVKGARSLVVLPPSIHKEIEYCDITTVADLTVVDQEFVDAVFGHNGSAPPRAVPVVPSQPRASDREVTKALSGLRAMLGYLDPDMGYSDWLTVLMAVHHETGGGEAGFNLVNEWSARGQKFRGEAELRSKWRSFANHGGPKVTVGTINAMLTKQGDDWMEISAAAEPQFEPCDDEVDQPSPEPPTNSAVSKAVTSVLAEYSITPRLEQLRQEEIEQQYVLEGIALMGQATVLYAPPGTGKTLLMLWMFIQSIKAGRIEASRVFYINCDDSLHGLLTKGEIAKTHGFHMLADGYEGFEIGKLRSILLEVMEKGQARGTVVVLDTLKKFVDLMNKSPSASFMKLIRRFVLQGGTVIMLAHANKKADAEGRPIYAGVADILDDADCGYIMWVTSERGSAERVVEFEVKKRRGNVCQQATFAYSGVDGLSYEQLLASVRRVGADEAVELHVAAVQRADDPIIEAAKACVREGICKRMTLVAEIARRTKFGRRTAEAVLGKYTGSDPSVHHWNYRIGPRGAKLFYLLEKAPGDEKPEDKSPDY